MAVRQPHRNDRKWLDNRERGAIWSDCSAATGQQANHEQDQEDNEQDFGNSGSGASYAAEAKMAAIIAITRKTQA